MNLYRPRRVDVYPNSPPSDLPLSVAWSGLPPYGLNGVRAMMVSLGVQPTVIGTLPDTAYDAIGKVAGLKIHWIDPADKSAKWTNFCETVPKVFIVSGWATPAFNALGQQVRANGGAVILMIDNRWRGDLRQWVSPIAFQIKYRRWFKAAIVPGKASRAFVRYLGFPHELIYEGLYGGNPLTFEPGPPLAERPKRFLFVGRFVERKGLRELEGAWRTVSRELPGWELHAVGEGPMKALLDRTPGVMTSAFHTPEDLSEIYQNSRFLVLPSHEDHWGVVVHEAALTGCGLILSENVGARFDLATSVNSFTVPAANPHSLGKAMLTAARMDERRLKFVFNESIGLASRFGPAAFADAAARAIAGIHSHA